MEHGPASLFLRIFLPEFWFRKFFSRTLNVYVGIPAISCSQLGNAKALPILLHRLDLTEPGARRCDVYHIRRHWLVLVSAASQTPCRRNSEDRTMTSFNRFSGLKAITLCTALSMSAGLALAADNAVSADQILNALQPKRLTRGMSMTPAPQVEPSVQAKEVNFLDSLRNRKTRSLSLGEREQIAEIAATKANIDLEIQFDYNSADISKTSIGAVQELGKAL